MTCAPTYAEELDALVLDAEGVTRVAQEGKSAQGFMSVDPLADQFAGQSPYQFAGNGPIQHVDAQGKYKLDPNVAAKYPRLARLLREVAPTVMSDKDVEANLMVTGRLSREGVQRFSKYGYGPVVEVAQLTTAADREAGTYVNGYTTARNGRGAIQLDQGLINALENTTSQEELDAAALAVTSTLLHETAHHGPIEESDRFSLTGSMTVGPYKRSLDASGNFENFSFNGEVFGTTREEGDALEVGVYYLRSDIDSDQVNQLNKQGPNSVQDMTRLRQANQGNGALRNMNIENENNNRP